MLIQRTSIAKGGRFPPDESLEHTQRPTLGHLELKNHEVIDALRAWKGRDQAYGVSFVQPKLKYFKSITIPILAMCSKDDVLWPCFHYCKELVSCDLVCLY
jgi:hypothetical protein